MKSVSDAEAANNYASAFLKLREAAKNLYEEVEMAESIGIYLPNREPSLTLGRILSGDFSE